VCVCERESVCGSVRVKTQKGEMRERGKKKEELMRSRVASLWVSFVLCRSLFLFCGSLLYDVGLFNRSLLQSVRNLREAE